MTTTTAGSLRLRSELWLATIGAYFPYLLFMLFGVSERVRGLAWALPATLVMLIVPVLDIVVGETFFDFAKEDFCVAQRWLLRFAPIGFVIGNTFVVIFTALRFKNSSTLEQSLMVLSVGVIGSIGVTAAHELVHKTDTLSKVFGRLGLANVCYLHFEINHIQGHHVHFGTDKDESTAWRGESLYSFVFRTIPRCLQFSWNLETKKLKNRGNRIFSSRNLMLLFLVFQLSYLAVLWMLDGRASLLLFVGQAAIAVFMLEAVSYVKHYGLSRERMPDGKYGAGSAIHSWDSYYRVSNYLEFQLQRHADHHAVPRRPHEELHISPAAPRLPAGYSVMISIAMIPPLWRRLMDPVLPQKRMSVPRRR
jgi:alkane 1-monooxygenase